jgi:hypothetical protein
MRAQRASAQQTVMSPDEAAARGQETLDAAIAWLKAQKCPRR